jgi:mRNA interferase MazF
MPIRQGEIYFVDFGPERTREPAYDRPVLVLSANWVNRLAVRDETIVLITVVPGTKGSNKRRDYSTHVRVPPECCGLREETIFRAFQMTSIDARRFPSNPAGQLRSDYFARVQDAVRLVLGIIG